MQKVTPMCFEKCHSEMLAPVLLTWELLFVSSTEGMMSCLGIKYNIRPIPYIFISLRFIFKYLGSQLPASRLKLGRYIQPD